MSSMHHDNLLRMAKLTFDKEKKPKNQNQWQHLEVKLKFKAQVEWQNSPLQMAGWPDDTLAFLKASKLTVDLWNVWSTPKAAFLEQS